MTATANRVIRSLALCALLAVSAGCRTLARDGGIKVSPERYSDQVRRCVAAAEAVTGLRCKHLRKAQFVETGHKAWSHSLRRHVAVDEAGRAGYWVPGRIVVYTLNGVAEDAVIMHEVAHQIAEDNGLGASEHCAEFKGKIWGW